MFGYQVLASHGLAPLSAPTVASGSSTVEPSRLPVSAHWACAGFQPLVSARMPTTRLPPTLGFCDATAEVSVDALGLRAAAAGGCRERQNEGDGGDGENGSAGAG